MDKKKNDKKNKVVYSLRDNEKNKSTLWYEKILEEIHEFLISLEGKDAEIMKKAFSDHINGRLTLEDREIVINNYINTGKDDSEKADRLISFVMLRPSSLNDFIEEDKDNTLQATIDALNNINSSDLYFISDHLQVRTGYIDDFISARIENPAATEEFLLNLSPSKVKQYIKREVNPQERELLTFTKEENSIRRRGSAEEIETVNKARIERTKKFFASLTITEAMLILEKGTGNRRYKTFTPVPTAGIEDYITIGTTQFSYITRNVIDFANLEEAAKNINRRKKRKVAREATKTVKGKDTSESYELLEVRERGGLSVMEIPATFPIEKIAENGLKEFDYVIGQIYKYCYDTERKEIIDRAITITDDDLVKYKVCGTDNRKVNRRNFLNFLTFLSNYNAATATGTHKRNKKGEIQTTIEEISTAPMFAKTDILFRKGAYELVPNKYFNWTAALRYYTCLPLSAFSLSGRAYKALSEIMQEARATATKRANPAETYISLKYLADVLQLPIETKEAKKLIKAPIRNIIDEINEIVKDVNLELEADENAPKAEYLTGRIKITFHGEILQSFDQIKTKKSEKYQKQLEKHNKKKEAAAKKEKKTK